MSDQTVEFAGKTWQRSGGVWLTAWKPPANCRLKFEKHIRVVGRHDFDDFAGENDLVAEVTEDQKAAASYFFDHHGSIIDEVLRQLLRYCRRIHDEDPVFFEDLVNVQTIDQLIKQVDELQVAIEHHAANGFAWLSLTGGCDWEMEHGLGICLWKDIVLDIGTYDTVLSGPDPAHTCLPALDDSALEKKRQSVIETLASVAELEAAVVEQAALESTPHAVRLCSALAAGNALLAGQLVADGVRLDDIPSKFTPPVFMAIQAGDPDLLKRMIELGAKTDVRDVDGQTPAEAAQQMLNGFRLSQRLQQSVLGDLSAMSEGQKPSGGGLMSMLGNLQNEAADLLSQMGEQPQSPAWDEEQIRYHQGNVQRATSEVNNMIPKLEEILRILSKC